MSTNESMTADYKQEMLNCRRRGGGITFQEFRQQMEDCKPTPRDKACGCLTLDKLSKRELDTLASIVLNCGDYPAVAEELMISETTVKTYVNVLFNKLRVNNKMQLFMAAFRLGLVNDQMLYSISYKDKEMNELW